jgi:hypothetical protein
VSENAPERIWLDPETLNGYDEAEAQIKKLRSDVEALKVVAEEYKEQRNKNFEVSERFFKRSEELQADKKELLESLRDLERDFLDPAGGRYDDDEIPSLDRARAILAKHTE